MPILRPAVESLRALRRCPVEALALRVTGREAELLALPDELDGLGVPWELPPPPGTSACGASGATWMPAIGRVAWEEDPDVHADADLLRRWSRGRLREALHAASAARDARDASAAAFAVERVRAFAARCPPFACDHWRSGMEIALRALRLLHAGARLRQARAGGVPVPSLAPIARALRLHEQALQSRTDWRLHRTGNHFLVLLAARVVLAACLPVHAERERRLRRDARSFALELARQLEPGGMHFESSTHYLVLVAEAAAHVRHALLARGLPAGELELAARDLVAEALPALLRPDGSLPSVGDGDDESVVPANLGPDPTPPLRGLEVAEALGPRAPAPPAWSSGGLLALVQPGPPALHVAISALGRGRAGTGGHFHDDATSYELWCDGPLLGHRGTGAYGADARLRERLRSVASHAALQVDAREMNDGRPGHAFQRRFRAHPWWEWTSPAEVVVGHHGFAVPAPGVVVLRRFRLLAEGGLAVEDEVTGAGTHGLVLRLPWAPDVEPGRPADAGDGDGAIALEASRAGTVVARCRIEARGPEGRPLSLLAENVRELHWPRQGESLEAFTTEIRLRAAAPVVVRHVMRPADGRGPRIAMT